MADPVFSLIRSALQLPDLQVHINVRWGSELKEHRELIHNELALLGGPQFQHSISHSPGLGGFILNSDNRIQLGFDIELTSRIEKEVAQRISNSPNEFSAAPSSASLWCAKEAAYKALKGPHQPKVISDICIGEWNTSHSQVETFKIMPVDPRAKYENRGALCRIKGHTLAFFTFRP